MRDLRTIHDMASLVRGRRIERGLSQSELARLANVSRKWVYEFEAGKAGAELGHVLAVLEALDLRLTARQGDARPGELDLDALLDDYSRP